MDRAAVHAACASRPGLVPIPLSRLATIPATDFSSLIPDPGHRPTPIRSSFSACDAESWSHTYSSQSFRIWGSRRTCTHRWGTARFSSPLLDNRKIILRESFPKGLVLIVVPGDRHASLPGGCLARVRVNAALAARIFAARASRAQDYPPGHRSRGGRCGFPAWHTITPLAEAQRTRMAAIADRITAASR